MSFEFFSSLTPAMCSVPLLHFYHHPSQAKILLTMLWKDDTAFKQSLNKNHECALIEIVLPRFTALTSSYMQDFVLPLSSFVFFFVLLSFICCDSNKYSVEIMMMVPFSFVFFLCCCLLEMLVVVVNE